MGKANLFGRIRISICPSLSLKLCTVGFALLLVQVAAGQDSDSPEKAGSIWDALGDLAEEVEGMERLSAISCRY
jgi:hypothetical protein